MQLKLFEIFVLAFQALVFIVVLALIVYLIIRRIKISQNEKFEKRDN
jgi:ABC-type phosphate transport system permease subunit